MPDGVTLSGSAGSGFRLSPADCRGTDGGGGGVRVPAGGILGDGALGRRAFGVEALLRGASAA